MDISLEQFKEITGVDIGAFFQDYTTLVNSYYAAIIAYYEGGDLPGDGFRLVDQLLKPVSYTHLTLPTNSLV